MASDSKDHLKTSSALLVTYLLLLGLPISQQQQQQPQQQQGLQISLDRGLASESTMNRPVGQQRIGIPPQDRPGCQFGSAQSGSHQLSQHVTNEEKADTVFNASISSQQLSAPTVVSLLLTESQTANSGSTNQQQIARKFDSSEKLRQLRQLLVSNSYDAYLVSPNDEHGSEYVSDYDRRLRFLTGFSGSTGYALILLDRAVLFTDGRYAIQAELELDCNWWLVVGEEPLADMTSWLQANAPRGIKIATDARLLPLQSYDYMEEQLRKMDSEFALISQDLVDVVWSGAASSQVGGIPRKPPQEPIFVHPIQFAGNITWQEKLSLLANEMARHRASHYIVSRLDDIAWLLNLRGSDIPMSPLFKAYILVSRSGVSSVGLMAQQNGLSELQATRLSNQPIGLQMPPVLQVSANQSVRLTLYIDLKKIDSSIRDYLHVENGTIFVQPQQHLQHHQQSSMFGARFWQEQQTEASAPMVTRLQVDIKDYDIFIMELRDRFLANQARQQQWLQGRLLIDAAANVAIHVLAKGHEDRLVLMEGLISRLKAVKSDSEVQGMRSAHWRDSLAISMLLSQLDDNIGLHGQVNKWTEVGASQELLFYRSLMDYNRGQSFDSVSAYGSNSAIIHYTPKVSEPRFIGNQSTYLLDSGGQYLDGTTDITRTVHFGQPTELQRETYTRVLMGSIDQMSLIFDQSSRNPSYRLNDLIARRHLFELGLDYMHGTGHGIGLYSLVHEQPYLIEHYTSSSSRRSSGASHSSGKVCPSGSVLSDPVPLQANMFTSVEPGYYKANDFGIRLENIVVSQKVNSEGRQFLRFEPISLVPFEPKLVKTELLSNKQKLWLNSYNLMVRFRLTQQINHYLARIRAYHQSQSMQVQGAASNSRIYQNLLASSSQAKLIGALPASNASLGLFNFLRMDSTQLQEKLEQTHRWVMAKTELLPLDLPQSLLSPSSSSQQQSNRCLSAIPAAGKPNQTSRRQLADDASEQTQRLEGQRLMLLYMSSLPFNGLEAREALTQLSARAERQANTSNQMSANGSLSMKACQSGVQCELWLASAIEPSQSGTATIASRRVRQDSADQTSLSSSWLESSLNPTDELPDSLNDWFQLSGVASRGLPLQCLLLLGFSLLLALQLVLVCFVCQRGATCKRGEGGGGGLRAHLPAQTGTTAPLESVSL